MIDQKCMNFEFSCCISCLLLCKQLHGFVNLRTYQFKTTACIISQCLWVGVWCSLAGSLGPRSFLKLESKHQPGLQIFQAPVREELLLSSLTEPGKLHFPAGRWHEMFVSCHMDLPIGMLTMWRLSLGGSEREKRELSQFFQNLISEVTFHYFYCIFTRSSSHSRGGDYTGHEFQNMKSLRAILESSYHKDILNNIVKEGICILFFSFPF